MRSYSYINMYIFYLRELLLCLKWIRIAKPLLPRSPGGSRPIPIPNAKGMSRIRHGFFQCVMSYTRSVASCKNRKLNQ